MLRPPLALLRMPWDYTHREAVIFHQDMLMLKDINTLRLGLRANLWTLTENDNSSAYNTRVYFNRDDFSRWAGSKNDGFSVRFLRE